MWYACVGHSREVSVSAEKDGSQHGAWKKEEVAPVY